HVTVEADALAGLEANGPHPDAVALRHERVADTWVGIVLLTLEFRGDFRRPRRFHRGLRLLVQHFVRAMAFLQVWPDIYQLLRGRKRQDRAECARQRGGARSSSAARWSASSVRCWRGAAAGTSTSSGGSRARSTGAAAAMSRSAHRHARC